MPLQAPIRVPTPSSTNPATLGNEFKKNTESKLKLHDTLIYAVLAVTVVALIGIVVGTISMYNDQAHFNFDNYKESADKIQARIDKADSAAGSLEKRIQDLTTQLEQAKKQPVAN